MRALRSTPLSNAVPHCPPAHTWYSTKLLMWRGGIVTQAASGATSRQQRRNASTREAMGGNTLVLRQPACTQRKRGEGRWRE